MPKKTQIVPQAALPEEPGGSPWFPIVGIGASAGGLKAFEAFFDALSSDVEPGMAFVLVQHLAPDHKSILADLVQRYTRMRVIEVEDGMRIEPNCTYIIPPNRNPALLDGVLQLLEPEAPRGQRLPIDYFFRSLAQDQHERAIGIILSGTGSDGTLGARAIKGEGGLVLVQDPESAEYDGMPRQAIAAGLADHVLPVSQMPAQIFSYTTGRCGSQRSLPFLKSEEALKKIFILLRAQVGHDFSHYKPSTTLRRIDRRMAFHRIEQMEDYVRYLQQRPEELDSLFRDLLIGVTHFFRDHEAFEVLEKLVVPSLFEGKAPGSILRIWVPGCSTGEEAYSLAILLQEHLERLRQPFQVQVFATDLDARAISHARAGLYPAGIAADVTPERLARFFLPESDGQAYRIHKNIRDLCIFSEQDVIRDPPFSKLDLISCRNVMIYMGPDLQKKLIPLFHYALNPGGRLFLGTSESVGEFLDLFATLDRKAKLYQRKENGNRSGVAALGRFLPVQVEAAPHRIVGRRTRPSLREITERALLQHCDPMGLLVNEQGEILYLHGRTGRYLEPGQGESSLSIQKMAREGLRRELISALHKVKMGQACIQQRGLRVKTNGDYSLVDLTVKSVAAHPGDGSEPEHFLVVLEEPRHGSGTDDAALSEEATGTRESDTRVEARIAAMKEELRVKEESLQTAYEELETSNEELLSSNEELQSMNEELQSINEELETSKEELQSVNEELATVNAELQQKVADLSRANNDMNNLLAGTGVGTVFVDHHLRIQRFTPAITQVIHLIHTDVGRPVGHIASNLVGYAGFLQDIQGVLDTLAPKELEVQTQAGTWYLLRIRPYRTLENVIEGAVITFTDITELRMIRAEAQQAESLRHLAAIVRDASDGISLIDASGRILAWNPGAERLYGWRESEALRLTIRDLLPEDQKKAALAELDRLFRGEELDPHPIQKLTKDGRVLEVMLTATALVDDRGRVYAVATTERAKSIRKPTES